jgi:hypothetical protein
MTQATPQDAYTSLTFPSNALVGSIGDLARVLAEGTEVPEEFYFACGLTAMGWVCSTKLNLNIGLDIEPRLYTVLLGASYDARKSTALKKTIAFFRKVINSSEYVSAPEVIYGVGSAEGLIRKLNNNSQLLLAYDELRAFVDKSKVQNSSLLPMTTSLFEAHNWDNATKQSKENASVRDAHLSLIGCCTNDTYANMWTNEAIAIGFPNRLFVVGGDRKCKVAWPKPPDESELDKLHLRILAQVKKLPLTLDSTEEARKEWEAWYNNLPVSEHIKRLDTIGLRLLSLITLTTDKACVDLEAVKTVISILDYEFKIRCLTDPVDADNTVARLEESIRRMLKINGPLRKRDLRRKVHADRYGIWAFETAIGNLLKAGDIVYKNDMYDQVLS